MIIRDLENADLPALSKIHAASGFDYPLPDLDDPRIFSRRAVCDRSGIGAAVLLKRTAEVYFLCDRTWRSPAWRAEALRQLHVVCEGDARREGVAEAVAFLPPEIDRVFGKRLRRKGWTFHSGEEWRAYGWEIDA